MASAAVVRLLLRDLLRETREIAKNRAVLLLDPSLSPNASVAEALSADFYRELAQRVVPPSLMMRLQQQQQQQQQQPKDGGGSDGDDGTGSKGNGGVDPDGVRRAISAVELEQAIHQSFHLPLGGDTPAEGQVSQAAVDEGLECLKFLRTQQQLGRRTSVTTTRGLRVLVTTFCFQTSAGRPLIAPGNMHVFPYRVTFENIGRPEDGAPTLQVLKRHWLFQGAPLNTSPTALDAVAEQGGKDAAAAVAALGQHQSHTQHIVEVPRWADRVVGLTPTLMPGTMLTYFSNTQLASAQGTMSGGFLVRDVETDEEFEAPVSETPLLAFDEHAD